MSTTKTTIHDVARASGVSVGTVSRALNGYADVREATRERIVRLAEELDYTPSASARALVTQRSHVVGVFLETGEGHPDLQHPFFHGVLVGLKDAIGAAGYDLLLFSALSPGNGFGPHDYLKRCRHHNVDGAVLFGMSPDDAEVRRLSRSEMPCIGIDIELSGSKATSVGSQNADGMALAVAHLVALGHTRIATIAGTLDTLPGRDRLRGYRDGLRAGGLTLRDEYVAHGDFYVESGLEATRRLLALPERPTAIACGSDMMAVGAIQAAIEAGLSVPRDLSIVGFDDMLLASHMSPTLTTLRQDKAGLGAAAGQALRDCIEQGSAAPPIELPVELIVRGSTAVAPTHR